MEGKGAGVHEEGGTKGGQRAEGEEGEAVQHSER